MREFSFKSADELIALGYSVVSRRSGLVARIDRPDWQKHMRKTVGKGLDADWYRRCLSRDVRTVPNDVVRVMPNSRDSDAGYVEPPQ